MSSKPAQQCEHWWRRRRRRRGPDTGLFVGETIVAEELGVDHCAFALVRKPAPRLRQLGSRYHGPHTGQGFGLAGVDGPDSGVGVGACGAPWRITARAGSGRPRSGPGRSPSRRRRGATARLPMTSYSWVESTMLGPVASGHGNITSGVNYRLKRTRGDSTINGNLTGDQTQRARRTSKRFGRPIAVRALRSRVMEEEHLLYKFREHGPVNSCSLAVPEFPTKSATSSRLILISSASRNRLRV